MALCFITLVVVGMVRGSLVAPLRIFEEPRAPQKARASQRASGIQCKKQMF